MQAIQGRSLLRGETTLEELRTLTTIFEDAAPLLDDDLIDAAYDAIVVDGDLRLPALDTFEAGLCILVVTGDLLIDGAYSDHDDPATGVFVLGNMRAGSVWTAGTLGVQGELQVARTLAGFYNDYSANLLGPVRAGVFWPENHWFDLRSEPAFDVVLGQQSHYRVPDAWRDLLDRPLRGRALLDRVDDALVHEQVAEFEPGQIEDASLTELLDWDQLRAFIQADRPLLKA